MEDATKCVGFMFGSMGAVGGFWSVPVPVSGCNTRQRGLTEAVRSIFTRTGPVQPFLTRGLGFFLVVFCLFVVVVCFVVFFSFSKGVDLETIIKGSCGVTFSLATDEVYKLSSENCLTLEASARSGLTCCRRAAGIFSPGLFATEKTGLTLVGFYELGLSVH